MKIKIAYGVDMRLWKHEPFDGKPQPQTYQDLITYIIKTFEFKDTNDFLIKFKDDDDELTTISSLQDFQEAYISYKEQEKKSLKLHIHDKVSNNNKQKININPSQQAPNEADEEEKKSVAPDTSNPNQNEPPIQSRYASSPKEEDTNNSNEPSPEEINAFLSDDFVIDLLSDLFIAVFEALEESQFEISFIECVQGIILSDDGKYDKLTSNKIWPYFCDQLLPKYSSKIEMFVIPMIRNNGINTNMIKQWIPTMLNMMKMHQQRRMDNNNFNGFGAGFGGFPWRGMHGMHNGPANTARGGHGHAHHRGGHHWRGRGWRHHHGHNDHHNHHGHGHGHGHYGRRGGRRGWRGHHGHHHGHGYGHNAWFNQDNNNNGSQEVAPSAPMEGVNDENEQMEQEEFEYTEELAAIMSMGFNNIGLIKKLLIQHKGNKQAVVQELVSSKN